MIRPIDTPVITGSTIHLVPLGINKIVCRSEGAKQDTMHSRTCFAAYPVYQRFIAWNSDPDLLDPLGYAAYQESCIQYPARLKDRSRFLAIPIVHQL